MKTLIFTLFYIVMLNFVTCEEPTNTTNYIEGFINNIKESDLFNSMTKKLSSEFEVIKNKFESTFSSVSDEVNDLLYNETNVAGNYKPSEITNSSTNLNETELNILKLLNNTSSLLHFS
ncbi:uncharacterized protein CMU_019760 [Cryptosporidium muris RN66]|uniref:Signal peptide-containing protein n=1 Tax=Cryptosporidium muris (strain RN66) TaxID=441375 RepID=B6AJ95_CRYMR|nr:uncharacterized protein CMU_019760 [Cryptosporidium muris RN66]EEA08233.1 hypothetical protein CMU_019760 [Cryptosporidium muris RN66]|eukprot:XP_002142582.1 hypothetical protein [Cryptosporidium muris RN66]